MSERWESWEHLFLHEVSQTMPISLIAEKLERTRSSIYSKAKKLDVSLITKKAGRTWTQAEVSLFGRYSPEEIAAATGRTIFSVRSKRNSLARAGGLNMREWSAAELALLMRHSNAEVAEITGRSIEEVGDKRLQKNIERNGWDRFDPEREDA